MARLTYTMTSFNGGEVSPLMDARFRLDFYPSTSKKLLNYIPTPQGPIKRRPGLKFVAEGKRIEGESSPIRLKEFVFGVDDALMLEFGHEYIRFYQDDMQVEDPGDPGNPLEVATPYGADDIFDLQFAQTADLLYMVHPDYAPRRLSRTSLAPAFSLEEVPFEFGPTLDENETDITLQASATTGTVTITASASLFNSDMVGGIWALTEPSGSLSAYPAWASSTGYTAGNFVRSEGSVYVAENSATSGNIVPTHRRGTVSDGGVNWTFVNRGTGYIKLTNFISNTQFEGEVQLRLPNTVTSTPTLFWNEAAWSDDRGWPRAIAFYEGRAFYAATREQPETLWASKTNRRFENFDIGDGLDDEALVFTASANSIDSITWLTSSSVLLAGTIGGVFVVRSSTIDQVITPSNVQIKKNTAFSASSLPPVLVNNSIVYSQRVNKKILTAQYEFSQDSFVAQELSLRAEHLLEDGIVDISYQQEPDSIVWMIIGNGKLVGMTLEEQQRVVAFHQHDTNTFGEVDLIQNNFESIGVLPLRNFDEVWLVVNRIIDGVERRYVEVMERDETVELYTDSAVLIEAPNIPAGALGGFDHLAGEEVQVLLSETDSASDDLAVSPNQVVNESGEIELPFDSNRVLVGLPYVSDLWTHKMVFEIDDGMNLSKPVKGHKIFVRLLGTLGMKAGFNENNLQVQPFRTTNDLMDNPPELFGRNYPKDYEVTFNGTWDANYPTVFLRQAQPLPSTVLSLSVITNSFTR